MGNALLIKSSAGQKQGVQGTWHKFEQATPYIQGIETGDLAEQIDAEVLNRMISGLPSVWARARAFAFAFKYTRRDANIDTSGLIKFYQSLVAEWKGLIALMALYPDRISISEPLYLHVDEEEKLFDLSSAFGRMLFEDVDLWCNPQLLKEKKEVKPFVQYIYYNNVLIGATSPYSLVFTAIDYDKLEKSSDIPWFRNGKFDDPLEYGTFNNDQLQKLYLLVNNLTNELPAFEELMKTNRNGKPELSLSSLYVEMKSWRKEIAQRGNQLVDEGALDAELIFESPYRNLFSIKQELYLNNGIFSFLEENKTGEVVDLQKILLQDDFIYSIAPGDEGSSLEESAVYYLTALDPQESNKKWYFPIPLSSYGLRLFKNKIGDLVGAPKENDHELRASFNPTTFKAKIELLLYVDGKKQTPIVREYDVKMFTGAQRNILMWPNFIAKDWSQYYLYSEYPSNARDIKMVPFFKDFSQQAGYESIEFIQNEKQNLVYIDEYTQSSDLEAERLIKYPVEIASSDDHPYEVIRANKPFAGLEIRSLINGKDRICGYFIVKKPNDDSMKDKKIADLSHETNFEDVVVGVDFGSNNSCISFSQLKDSQVNPIHFNNRRVFILGNEIKDPRHVKTAERNELLFFQNESTDNGQVKSWVHDHNHKYIPGGAEQEEISGGVPVFEPNLVIHDMNERTITTNAGKLHHSMKWLTDLKGKEKKKAYLKTLWVKTIADLYAMRKLPKQLRWSYPGSFSQFDVLQYKQMYNEFTKTPIRNVSVEVTQNPSTEAEAVCNYALTNVSLSSTNILLGIDVGGSTSDVLVVSMDRAARAFKMNKQSSLRLAAGILSDIVKRSVTVRQAIYQFHESSKCKIKVANIKNLIDKPNTAPFYFNAILDRLRDDEFNDFYSTLAQKTPEIFSVPAFITGLLLYYSGQLVAKSIDENQYTQISMVDLLPFGKGGRIFDWLDTYPGKSYANEYYSKCFKTGFGENADNINIEKKDNIRKDNKSEVSKGLSAPQRVQMDEVVRNNSDILGENGYLYYPQGTNQPEKLNAMDNVDTRYLAEMDFGIEFPAAFPEFNKFFDIFIDFVGPRKTGIVQNIAALENQRNNLVRELKSFVINDREWQKANEQKNQGQEFDFKHSLLVLEGICFLEKFIIPEVFK